MSNQHGYVYRLGELLYYLLKGLIAWILMVFLCLLTLFLIFYLKFSYDKVTQFIDHFSYLQKQSAKLLPFLAENQTPILKFRKNPDFSEKNFVLSYELNNEQMYKTEQYLNKFQASAHRDTNRITCIDPTRNTKWLFPRISRHYVVDPEFITKDYNSFLVYGSAKYLQKVERACSNGQFIVATFRLKNVQNLHIQMALNKDEKVLMVNYKTEN